MFVIAVACTATSVPRLTVEQLVDGSESIVSGRAVRSWSSWDRSHQFVWTHHEIALEDVVKGELRGTVVVSEPGGAVDGKTMVIPGAVQFTPGEDVVLFLYRTPVGYLRTVGYGQGKYSISHDRRIRSYGTQVEFVAPVGQQGEVRHAGTPLKSLEGLPLPEFKQRVAKIVRMNQASAR
ncbi:MAG: hypothetical protein M3Z36_01170 [Acidobacteriota bacterium]|nr:hypothetical protein [Acidobacteriota bacterium]